MSGFKVAYHEEKIGVDSSRVVLITGGARSGKSAYAESWYQAQTDVMYLATARIEDEDMRARVKLHQQSRNSAWQTFEGTYQLHQAVTVPITRYLLDCITVLTSNILFDRTADAKHISAPVQQAVEQGVLHELELLVEKVRSIPGSLVMVTNEVGCSVVPEHPLARVFRDILGRVNQRTAALCDEVYLVACGLPVRLK